MSFIMSMVGALASLYIFFHAFSRTGTEASFTFLGFGALFLFLYFAWNGANDFVNRQRKTDRNQETKAPILTGLAILTFVLAAWLASNSTQTIVSGVLLVEEESVLLAVTPYNRLDCVGASITCSDDGNGQFTLTDAGGGGVQSLFETIDAPVGTDPVADNANDTLQFLTSTAELLITGAAAGDSLDFTVVDDALDFTELSDAMTLDASTQISFGSNDLIFQVANPGSNAIEVNGTGAFTADLFHVHQHTGNPTGGVLIYAEAVDMDITPLVVIHQDAADITSGVVSLLISAVDDDDVDWVPLRIIDDADVGADVLVEISSTGAITAVNVTSGADPGHTHTGASLSGIDVSDDVNLAAGTNITLVGDTLNVDDSFLLHAGDIGTGVFDFGGATSFEIVNAAAPVVDTLGEIAVDTTDDQLIYFGTALEVLTGNRQVAITIESPADVDNFLIGKLQDGITVTDVHCLVDPADAGESAVIDIQERDGTADNPATLDATITCDNDGAEDDGAFTNGTLDAGDWWGVDIGAITGTVTQVSIIVYYNVVRE